MSEDIVWTMAEIEEAWARETRHNLRPLRQVASGVVTRPPWLLEGMLLDRTVTCVSAEPFTGKTMLMIGMMVALDSGRPLFDTIPVPKQKRVLFVGQDGATWDYYGIAHDLTAGLNLPPEEVQSLVSDMLINEGVLITDPGFVRWMKEWHHATAFDVLMLDTFLEVHNLDEASNTAMRGAMNALKRLRDDLGIAVVFSTHVRKPQQGVESSANYAIRGASAIAGGLDFHIQLSKRRGKDFVKLEVPKSRGVRKGQLEPPEGFVIDAEAETIRLVPVQPETEGAEAIVLGLLHAGPQRRIDLVNTVSYTEGMSMDEAGKAVNAVLRRLKRSGKADTTERGVWAAT